MRPIEYLFSRWIVGVGALVLVVVIVLVIFFSQLNGGFTWDESVHLHGLKLQLQVAKAWLGGDDNASFRQLPSDLAFYGTVSIFPAHAASGLAAFLLGANEGMLDTIAHYGLHAIAFASGLLTLVCTYLILDRVVSARANAVLGTGLLALYPLWLGYTFFDYKDVPTAAFAVMALLAGVRLLEAKERGRILRFAGLLSLATILIAGTKIAALALILPSWAVAIHVLLRARMFSAFVVLCGLSVVGIVLITPVSWPSPLAFAFAAVELMSRHAWSNCTMTAGDCLGPQSAEWSSLRYLAPWLGVQIPLVIMAGIAISLPLLLRRQAAPILIAASAAVPLALIVARNSSLYDGLRHVLFVIPIMFILAVWAFDQVAAISRAARRGVQIAMGLQAALFAADNVAMFPYNYVYFNGVARHFADHSNWETEYWGFSFKQAARMDTVLNSGAEFAIANPAHLAEPFLPKSIRLVESAEGREMPPETQVVSVMLTRLSPAPPEECSEVEWLERRLPFSGRTLRLAYVASCEARDLFRP